MISPEHIVVQLQRASSVLLVRLALAAAVLLTLTSAASAQDRSDPAVNTQRGLAVQEPSLPPSSRVSLADNEPWRYVGFLGAIVIALVLAKVAQSLLQSFALRLDARGRNVAASTCRALSRAAPLAIFAVGVNAGLMFLLMGPTMTVIAANVLAVLKVVAIGYTGWCLVDVAEQGLRQAASRTPSKLDDMLAPLVSSSLRGVVLVLFLVTLVMIFSGQSATSILAGLGVGGIAIGLAAQDTIKNFFGSLMIFSDRPFELGDRIIVDSFDGTVETVGFRSTRLRTGDGDLVTIPNGELANKSILNAGKRPSLKRAFNVGVTYSTPPDKLTRAVQIIQEILNNHEGMDPQTPPRIFFSDLKDSSLSIAVMYWYHPPDFWRFSAFNERVNFEILRRFQAEGIEFAYPTQTILMGKEGSAPSAEGNRDRLA